MEYCYDQICQFGHHTSGVGDVIEYRRKFGLCRISMVSFALQSNYNRSFNNVTTCRVVSAEEGETVFYSCLLLPIALLWSPQEWERYGTVVDQLPRLHLETFLFRILDFLTYRISSYRNELELNLQIDICDGPSSNDFLWRYRIYKNRRN